MIEVGGDGEHFAEIDIDLFRVGGPERAVLDAKEIARSGGAADAIFRACVGTDSDVMFGCWIA